MRIDSRSRRVRGTESDVLSRFEQTTKRYYSAILIRVTADCRLLSPDIIDETVHRLLETDADYSTNIIEGMFPRGLDIEAITFECFKRVHRESTAPRHREHVNPCTRKQTDQFNFVCKVGRGLRRIADAEPNGSPIDG